MLAAELLTPHLRDLRSGMFGLGIVLCTSITSAAHLDHALFGNMLGVGPEDLCTAGITGIAASALLLLKWKGLMRHPASRWKACRRWA